MKPERFGSYSTVLMVKGMFNLLYVKSISRKSLLCPPPLCRVVMRPVLFRPLARLKPLVRDFVGSFVVVNFLNSTFEVCRIPADVGLYFFMVFIYSEPVELYYFDFISFLEFNISLLASTFDTR